MNRLHHWYCRTGHWSRTVEHDLLDWTLDQARLGDDLLELGAGAGTVTAHLGRHVARLTAVDLDGASLSRLRGRIPVDAHGRIDTGPTGARVRAVRADAAVLPFGTGVFSSVAAFTMLHHLPGTERQQLLLAETRRVLRPGGAFLGCDAVWTLGLRLFHLGDTFAPVEPDRWASDLRAAGFDDVRVSTAGRYVRWRARRPH